MDAKNLVAGVVMVMTSGAMGLQAVSATEFRFDQVDAGPASSLTYTVDGVTATATGLSLDSEGQWNDRNIQTVASQGMGTWSGGVSAMSYETLWFSFSEALSFTSAEFFVNEESTSPLSVYVLDGDGQNLQTFTLGAGLTLIDLTSLAYTGDVIGFRSRQLGPGGEWIPIKPRQYDWSLASVVGEVSESPSVVPTPAAAGLGLIGLAGLALRRRRENV